MILGIGIILLFVSVLYKIKYKSWNNPGSIFLILWGSIFILYSLKLFNIYDVDISVIRIFLLGIVAFTIGTVPIKFVFKKSNIKNNNSNNSNNSFEIPYKKRKIFLAISLIALIILTIKAINLIPYWISGGADNAKISSITEGDEINSRIINILFTFFAKPVQMISIFLTSITFFFYKDKLGKFQNIITFLMLIMIYIGTASKFLLFFPIVSFLICYLTYNRLNKERHFLIKNISFLDKLSIFLIAISIILILIFLMNKQNKWIEKIYMYLVGCIPCGVHALKDIIKKGKYYYGMITFNGFFRFVSQAFAMIGIVLPYSTYMNEAYQSMMIYEQAILISPTQKYNAFITCFAYFYKDFGILGVFVLSLLFGVISKNVYKKYLSNVNNTYYLIKYLYIIYLIFFSIIRIQTFLVPNVMIIIYIEIFFKYKEKNEGESIERKQSIKKELYL